MAVGIAKELLKMLGPLLVEIRHCRNGYDRINHNERLAKVRYKAVYLIHFNNFDLGQFGVLLFHGVLVKNIARNSFICFLRLKSNCNCRHEMWF